MDRLTLVLEYIEAHHEHLSYGWWISLGHGRTEVQVFESYDDALMAEADVVYDDWVCVPYIGGNRPAAVIQFEKLRHFLHAERMAQDTRAELDRVDPKIGCWRKEDWKGCACVTVVVFVLSSILIPVLLTTR